jgi:hypothetical protein
VGKLTLKEVFEGLRGLGIEKARSDDEGYVHTNCPVCGTEGALRIGDGAFGLTLECENNTPDQIEGAIRYGISRLRKAVENPIQYVRETLEEPTLKHIIKHGKAGSSYILQFEDDTTVELGGAAVLTSQTKFRIAYLPQRRRLPTKYALKEGPWNRLVECIEQAAEERDNVTSDAEEARGWVHGFVRQTRGAALDTTDTEALYDHLTSDAGTFTDQDHRLHVRLTELTAWVNHVGGGRGITGRDLSTRLSELGFTKVQHAARRPSHITRGPDTKKVRYYASTPHFDEST